MTVFTPAIPDANHTLATDQPLMLANFTYLNDTMNVDHNIQNNTAIAQNGHHKIIHYITQGVDPPNLLVGQLYTKIVGANAELFYKSGTSNVVTQLTPSTGILRAAASFQGRGSNGLATINYSTNVTSVTRTAKGFYTVTMTTPMPSANYYVSAIGAGPTSADEALTFLTGGFAFTTTQFSLNIITFSGTDFDPTTCMFMVFQ